MRHPHHYLPLSLFMVPIVFSRSMMRRRHEGHISLGTVLMGGFKASSAFTFPTQCDRGHGATRPTGFLSPMISKRCQTYASYSSSSRLFSTTEKPAQVSITNINNDSDQLLDPYDILRSLQPQSTQNDNSSSPPKIPLPTHLSPTSLEQFSKCPQAFFFLYILKLTPDPPMTPQLARGIICHTALEEVFDLSPGDRSLENLENLFRREWGRLRGDRENNNALLAAEYETKNGVNLKKSSTKKDDYDSLFREERSDGTAAYDIHQEIEWGKSSLDLLKNYYDLEDPSTVQSPNPLMREMWVQARFPCNNNYSEDTDQFIVRGKIDRIDVLQRDDDSEKIHLEILDYKTGKKPWFKYSPKVNERIEHEQFWKMKVYALILWKMILQTDELSSSQQSSVALDTEQGVDKEHYKYGLSWVLQQRLMQAITDTSYGQRISKWGDILQLDSLRLMYLTSHIDDVEANGDSPPISNNGALGKAKYLDYPLGTSPSEFQSILDQTQEEVQTIAQNMKDLVDMQSPHAFEHCDWRYCSCHELRRKFRPGSVYKSPDLDY